MLSLPRGLDFEALRTRRNSRNQERTRAKRLFNRFAHSAGPSCVRWVLSSKKVKEVSWANLRAPCLAFLGDLWPNWDLGPHIVPMWMLFGDDFRIMLAHLGAHWGHCWANLAQHGQTLLQEGSPTHFDQRSPPMLAILADLGPMLGHSWIPFSAPIRIIDSPSAVVGPQIGLRARF